MIMKVVIKSQLVSFSSKQHNIAVNWSVKICQEIQVSSIENHLKKCYSTCPLKWSK